MPTFEQSRAWLERADKVLPGHGSCYSRSPVCYVRGATPAYIERGEGCRLHDVDGNAYLDFTMGLAPVILGHAHPVVNEAARRHLDKGMLYSLPHRNEVELAEVLTGMIPCAEKVRFGKNGADATSAAVRAARVYTGRDMVAVCGYHGWHDWYIAGTDQNAGIPAAVGELTVRFNYNDIASLESLFERFPNRIACVIMEPMAVTWPQPVFLEAVRETASRQGAVLVFDEIVTGFRWSLGGAQEYFGVIPDLACFSKAMANGFPISAVAGRSEIMDCFGLGKAFWSTTYGDESLSMAAALATLSFLRDNDVVGHIWDMGKRLMEGFTALVAGHGLSDRVRLQGAPPRHVLVFEDDPDLIRKSYFQQECARRGLLTLWCHNMAHVHGPAEVAEALAIYDEVLGLLQRGIEEGDMAARLEGEPVRPVFRRT